VKATPLWWLFWLVVGTLFWVLAFRAWGFIVL
jgi:hypothetical protein